MAKREIDGVPDDLRMVHVSQEIDGTDTSALLSVMSCDYELIEAKKEEQRLRQTRTRIQKLFSNAWRRWSYWRPALRSRALCGSLLGLILPKKCCTFRRSASAGAGGSVLPLQKVCT